MEEDVRVCSWVFSIDDDGVRAYPCSRTKSSSTLVKVICVLLVCLFGDVNCSSW